MVIGPANESLTITILQPAMENYYTGHKNYQMILSLHRLSEYSQLYHVIQYF